ncbi:MAG: glycosyltransferase [Actinomycetes bacterium]
MLERVPLLDKDLADYAAIIGGEAVERIRDAARVVEGARVLHVSATPYGGGVAELLATHVPLLRSVGVDADWQVIHGSDEFFGVTKNVHNALQGAGEAFDDRSRHVYLEKVLENTLLLEGEHDFVVIHDPQPAAMRTFRDQAPSPNTAAKWIWRCHIDLTDARPDVWDFFLPHVALYDASVWTMPGFVPASMPAAGVHIAPPCIDPLSVKNLDLPDPFVTEICRQYGIDTNRPMLVQVSRFDPWKDPLGVLEAYRIAREQVPDLQLVLAGSMATDDPEGFHVWETVDAARAGERDVHLLSNIQQVGNVQINAFQRAADVVVQKSLREGFGLTVAEALWKGRPVLGGNVGGIVLQIRDGVDGHLVSSVEETAARALELLRAPDHADSLGANGREHVRSNFLSTRELEDWLTLFGTLA